MKKRILFLAIIMLFITGCSNDLDTPKEHTHDYVWIVDINPTTNEVGYKHEECTICNQKINERTEIPKLDINSCNHVLVYNIGFDATCLNDGLKQHYKCSKCEKTFEDDLATIEVTNLKIPNHGHKYIDPTYSWNNQNTKCSAIASCIYDSTHILTEDGISLETIKSQATCVVDGKKTITVTFNNDIFKQQTKEITYKEPHIYDATNKCTNCNALNDNAYLSFEYSNDLNGYIVYCTNKDVTQIEIPCTYNDKPVVGIKDEAFYECFKLTNITIPESVTSIGEEAFDSCYSLTSITIPSCVTSIGSDAFYHCYKLVEVYNLSSIEIHKIFNKNYRFYSPKAIHTNINEPTSIIRTADGIEFIKGDDDKYYLFNYTGTNTDIVLPNNINGFQYEINQFAFFENEEIEYINIPNGVTSIGEVAFYGCRNLKNITISNSILEIGYEVFSHCSNLKSISIPNSVTSIGEGAFEYCYSLSSITIPESVTSIGSRAFYYCDSLTSITIPSCVTSIGSDAFYHCYKLVEVYNLSSLDIEIGSSNHGEIGYYAKVIHTDINTPSSIIRTNDGFEFIKDKDNKYYLFNYTGTDTDIVLPNNINGNTYEINQYAFYNNKNIVSVIISEGVTSIGFYAFEYCSNLIRVTIPSSVTSIGFSAFGYCSRIKNITIEENSKLENIGSDAFSYCSNLTSITIPSSVTSIGSDAFYHCYKLVEVYNLSSLDIEIGSSNHGEIGYYAKVIHTDINTPSSIIKGYDGYDFFKDSKNNYYLINYTGNSNELILPETINGNAYGINENAFYDYKKLNIVIPNTITNIIENAFYNTNIVSVYYNGTIEDWCKITFSDSTANLMARAEHFYLKNSNNEYYELNNLTELVIPEGVTSIGSYAFYGCSNLTSIVIPNSVTTIGEGAFSGCSNLESITLPFVGNSIKSYLSRYPFGYIFGTSSYTNSTATYQRYYGSSTTSTPYDYYYIPNSLKTVTITGGNIYYGAFSHCSNLTSITLGNAVTSIGEDAFEYCENLTSIGEGAFEYCYSLSSITIPESVTSIGSSAFYRCYKLVEVYNLSNLDIQQGSTNNGSIARYAKVIHSDINTPSSIIKTDDGFEFIKDKNNKYYLFNYTGTDTDIVLPENINGNTYEINNYAFHNNVKIVSTMIPEGVTSIGDNAFYNCSNLTSISIPSSVTSIGNHAFDSCYSLSSIIIPNSVTSIGSSVFTYCRGLIIYCEALSKPGGWDSNWNYSDCHVVWNYKYQ